MIRDCPEEENKNFYYIFIELLYDVFNKPCRNLNELRHMAMLLYPKYIEPINEGKGIYALLFYNNTINKYFYYYLIFIVFPSPLIFKIIFLFYIILY